MGLEIKCRRLLKKQVNFVDISLQVNQGLLKKANK